MVKKREIEERNEESEEEFQELANAYAQAELHRWRLDPRDILTALEHNFRGEVFDYNKRKWVEKREPLMNDEGVNTIMGLVDIRISRAVILSNLNEEDIFRICLDFNAVFINLLFTRYKDFGIRKEHLSPIRSLVDDAVFVTLKRALNGGEREILKGDTKRLETHTFSDREEEKKGGGFFGRIFRR